jgi:hypothetical protein
MASLELRNVSRRQLLEAEALDRCDGGDAPEHVAEFLRQSLTIQLFPLIEVLPDVRQDFPGFFSNSGGRVQQALVIAKPRVHRPHGRFLVFVKAHANLTGRDHSKCDELLRAALK